MFGFLKSIRFGAFFEEERLFSVQILRSCIFFRGLCRMIRLFLLPAVHKNLVLQLARLLHYFEKHELDH